MDIKTLCVFCGSRPGLRGEYLEAARYMGPMMAREGLSMVFGGGNVGMMGQAANSALEAGVRVTGIQPYALEQREAAHQGLTELILVETMHQRKQLMAQMSDAFWVLPGGIGTLEELAEMFTWNVLGIHQKPIAIWDIEGYYQPLIQFFHHMADEGFLSHTSHDMLIVDTEPERLLRRMRAYQPPSVPAWLTPAQL